MPLFNGLLFVDPAGAQSLGITFAGAGPETLNLPVPLNPALINATFFSQCIEFDVNFTTAFSNALQIQIGFL